MSEDKLRKITLSKNLRKRHNIHIVFKISSSVIQMQFNDDSLPKYSIEITRNGIIIFIFKIVLLNKPMIAEQKKIRIK